MNHAKKFKIQISKFKTAFGFCVLNFGFLPISKFKTAFGFCALNLVFLALLIVGTACSRKASVQQVEAWNAELRQLQAEQDSLRQRAQQMVKADVRIQNLPKGEVVLAVPTVFLHRVIERLFTDVVSNVTLRLSGIKARVAKPVKKVVTIGEFEVNVEITEVIGKLKPGQPEIKFVGNKISMSLPVEVADGRGEAIIHFVWDGKNVAGMTCGDMDVTQKVSGKVVPTDYLVSGELAFSIRGKNVIGTLTFPETKLNIRVTPSQESWDAVNAILAEKRGVCGVVLDKVDVPNLLTNIVEKKGFNVKLPLDKIKPFVLPAGVSQSVPLGEKTIALDAQTNSIRIDPDAIWYSASVALKPAMPEERGINSKPKIQNSKSE
jgi:hypothetical protein